jgi:hypothetical protein
MNSTASFENIDVVQLSAVTGGWGINLGELGHAFAHGVKPGALKGAAKGALVGAVDGSAADGPARSPAP